MICIKKEGEKIGSQKRFLVGLILVLAAFLASCTLHPLGSKKLSDDSMEQIVEGLTSKDEIRSLLGVPIEAKIFDEMGLANELNQTFSERPTGYMFPEGHYEMWTYRKLSKSLFLGRNIEERSIIIMNSSGTCIAKFYVRNGELIE